MAKKQKKEIKAKKEKDREQSSSCWYMVDSCGCYSYAVDPCGCVVADSCCC